MEKFYLLKKSVVDSSHFYKAIWLLLSGEIILLGCIIKFVSYTEIDWLAYMQEVEGVLNGTLDYAYLKGDTGPLVYPAGFVAIFTLFYFMTDHGMNILIAQLIYAVLYLLNLLIVVKIYHRLSTFMKYPPYMIFFLGFTGYRVHSIYVLRLFNDPVAMLLLYMAVALFLEHRWTSGCIFYSLAVSVKMNVLLFAPGILVVLVLTLGWQKTLWYIIFCGSIQLALGAPFLWVNPVSYIRGAFNFGRQFFFQWTVNWRFLPEWIFLHRGFHFGLLILHILVLLLFSLKHWTRPHGLKSFLSWNVPKHSSISQHKIAWILFTSNFIGMCFARSLHYQFYVWYFHSLPLLLWSTNLHSTIKVCILLGVECAWNVYPSTVWSSLTLHLLHSTILVALYITGPKNAQQHRSD